MSPLLVFPNFHPILLIAFVLFLVPDSNEGYRIAYRKMSPALKNSKNYADIFNARNFDSRVHVYCFNWNMDLVPIGMDLELFLHIKPELSAYPNDPLAAAASLRSLLDKAERVVPKDLKSKTPVRVRAIAGLGVLGNDASKKILQAASASLESLAKGAVKFSWKFTVREIQERWHSLLYDPIVFANAAFYMVEFECSALALPSKPNRGKCERKQMLLWEEES